MNFESPGDTPALTHANPEPCRTLTFLTVHFRRTATASVLLPPHTPCGRGCCLCETQTSSQMTLNVCGRVVRSMRTCRRKISTVPPSGQNPPRRQAASVLPSVPARVHGKADASASIMTGGVQMAAEPWKVIRRRRPSSLEARTQQVAARASKEGWRSQELRPLCTRAAGLL